MSATVIPCAGVGTWCGTSTKQYIITYLKQTGSEYALGAPSWGYPMAPAQRPPNNKIAIDVLYVVTPP